MTNTPEYCTEDRFWHLYHTNNCDQLLKAGSTKVEQKIEHNPPLNGIVVYRLETRTSTDGSRVYLVDIYTNQNGVEQEFPVVLEIDGQEYLHPYVPRPIS